MKFTKVQISEFMRLNKKGMKQLILILITVLLSIAPMYAKSWEVELETSQSIVENGVKRIQRICPTMMWDSWTFRDIMYDRESKTVLFVIQLISWSDDKEERCKQMTEAEAPKQAEWIVANFKEAYDNLITNPSVTGDGDFMLYLSLGTLFKQMEKEGTNLRIMLLKPDYTNQVFGDIPLELNSEQLKEIKTKD